MNENRVVAASLLGGAAVALICIAGVRALTAVDAPDLTQSTTAETTVATKRALTPIPPPPPEPTWHNHEIQSGETLGKILGQYGISTNSVLSAAQDHHDLSRIRAGRTLGFLMDEADVQPVAIRYALDEDRTLMVTRTEHDWTARVDAIIYEPRLGLRDFTVESSLWKAAIDAGLRAADIASLARVFEYDIDFNTELRQGDHAEVVVEELWSEGEFVRLGAPMAVQFTSQHRTFTAIRYAPEGRDPGYYDGEGNSRKKAFLRSPLEFSRVTSGFTLKRFHPILKRSRPHLGTDFAAPTGTPVRSVGKGKVTVSGRNGGHGNFVKIDHEGPYLSSYSHLSRIAVKRGETVRQGQVIGYVGSTGLATGPHLHYQFWANGRIVDPMTVKLPRTERLSRSDMANFTASRDRWLAMLDAADENAIAQSGDTASP